MRFKYLLLMSLWGILLFFGSVNAQETIVTPVVTPHEALLIPLFHSNPGSTGSSVFWSPDSHYIVVSDPDFSLTEAVSPDVRYGVFDVLTGQFLFDISVFVDWLPDSKHIVTREGATTDAQIRDVPTGKVTMTLEGAQIGWKWNSDRTQAASESVDNNLNVYNLVSGAILQSWRNILVKDALWSDDDRLIAVFGVDTILRVYDVISGSLKGQLLGYRPLGWKPDNRQLIVTPQKRGYPDQLGIWTLESGTTRPFDVLSLNYLWSPDGNQLAIVTTDQSIHIVDANTGKFVLKIDGFASKISLYSWDQPDRLVVVTGDLASAVEPAFEVFSLPTGSRVMKALLAVPFSTRIVDNRLQIIQECQKICNQVFDLDTGKQLSQIDFQSVESAFLFVSPDYRWMLNPTFPEKRNAPDQMLHLIDVGADAEVSALPGYQDLILYITWSPDSHFFAVIAQDSVRIWAVESP